MTIESPEMSRMRGVGYALGLPLVFALLVFGAAGSLRWPAAWVLLVVLVVSSAIACGVIAIANPVIFRARSRIQPGTESWDRWIIALMGLAALSIMPVAAFDVVRCHASTLPVWAVALGDVGVVVGIGLLTWAQVVNPFFEPGVRLQTDRRHHVIETGPYRYLRHPGYVAAMKLFFGLALALGSTWALGPAALASAVLIPRTAWEDRLLRDHLPGYAAYAKRVRWRLLWGVW